MKYISKSLEDTQKIAEEFISSISADPETAIVVGLYGDLGAGKTSFTQSIAKIFGVEDKVTSPTFVIEKIYELPKINELQKFTHMIHIDAYRLEKSEELLHLGWQEIISDKNNIIFIEWPERVENIMPEHIKIHLKPLEVENSREIEIDYK